MSAKSSRSSPGGNALLDEAIHDEDKHAVQFLLDHGVIPNDRNLAIAIDSGDVDMVRFLFLSNNADFSQKARQVADLLQLVLEVDHADPNFLISWVPYDDHDDVPNITWTPLHLAIYVYGVRGLGLPVIALECVEHLITYGAQVNSLNGGGRTPLHLGAKYDWADAVICLLRHGADPNLADHKSMTPLHIACRKGFLATAKALLQGGADPNAVNARGWTCVNLAIAHGREDVLRWLIQEAGASPRPRVPRRPCTRSTLRVRPSWHPPISFVSASIQDRRTMAVTQPCTMRFVIRARKTATTMRMRMTRTTTWETLTLQNGRFCQCFVGVPAKASQYPKPQGQDCPSFGL